MPPHSRISLFAGRLDVIREWSNGRAYWTEAIQR
jgi:hypothetical protein